MIHLTRKKQMKKNSQLKCEEFSKTSAPQSNRRQFTDEKSSSEVG